MASKIVNQILETEEKAKTAVAAAQAKSQQTIETANLKASEIIAKAQQRSKLLRSQAKESDEKKAAALIESELQKTEFNLSKTIPIIDAKREGAIEAAIKHIVG